MRNWFVVTAGYCLVFGGKRVWYMYMNVFTPGSRFSKKKLFMNRKRYLYTTNYKTKKF